MKKYVHSLGEGFMTISEVAEQLGRPESTVRRVSDSGVTQAPSFVAPFGRWDIRVYTPDDLEALREHFGLRPAGGADEDREESEGQED